jgi:outer membrane protein OmpA-like peptidoglycan-associated protein
VNRGVLEMRVITIGVGETRPVADNSTESGRAINRRVELTLVPVTQTQ